MKMAIWKQNDLLKADFITSISSGSLFFIVINGIVSVVTNQRGAAVGLLHESSRFRETFALL